MRLFRWLSLGFIAALTAAAVGHAQAPSRSGWEVNGLPALNFDADEGIGYGLIGQMYKYADRAGPYAFTVQPTIFFTTKGRRDFTVFMDAPNAFGTTWRVDAYAGSERQLSTPYYGIGNATEMSEALQNPPNEYFYRFGKKRTRFYTNIQHALGNPHLRGLVGMGFQSVKIDQTPFDQGTTLLANEMNGRAIEDGKLNYLRAGMVWDTRDVETGTRSGTWSDLLVQRIDKKLGSTTDFTRITGTVRHYRPIGRRVVFAGRVIGQNVNGAAPFYDLATVQGSFKEAEGLGGSSTVRGLPKNRFLGKGILIGNSELRWNAASFSLRGKSSGLILNAFTDGGRVFEKAFASSSDSSGMHIGYGGGARLAYGNNFVVAVDVAHSALSTAPVYIGLGYLF